MPVFEQSVVIAAPVGKVFEFHTDTANLGRVQPVWASIKQFERKGNPGKGALLSIETGGPVSQRWQVVIEEWLPPEGDGTPARIVDRALEGPFPEWRHEHRFDPEGNGTRMTDRIVFQPPLRPIGWLLLPGIYVIFSLMFRARHQKTRALLES